MAVPVSGKGALAVGLLLVLVVSGCRTRQPVPSEARGAKLYAQYCQACHGGATGGRVDAIPPPHNRNGHTWHHPDCQLEEIILSGFDRGDPAVPAMPAFRGRLSEDDVRAILAYIKTWWDPEQRAAQARVTRARC